MSDATNAQRIVEEIRRKRARWVEANRENGFEEGIYRLLSDLYPDQAHFVYELLQNAEDAGATQIHFQLGAEKLVAVHNGSRRFNEKDVGSITSIGASTKRDEVNKIGKFGVGFKAVFAYTSTPHVYSGDYAFRITDLVVPECVADKDRAPQSTAFEFPFNGAKSADRCFREIAKWLGGVTPNVLLFLRNIREISWEIAGVGDGRLLRRERRDSRIIEMLLRPAGQIKDERSYWLRFERALPDNPTLFVAVAWRLEANGEDSQEDFELENLSPLADQARIAPVDGQLSIYFPAEKEVTKLKFHIHGPFASTIARDSIADSKENADLLEQIAFLTADSLTDIKELGLLTPDFLKILPIPGDNLKGYYELIRRKVQQAMQEKPLTPVHGGGHSSSQKLIIGPAAIRSAIGHDTLGFFTGDSSLRWAAGVMQGQREYQFLQSLKIKEWGWADLLLSVHGRFAETESAGANINWLARRPDEWMQAFYALLKDAISQRYSHESQTRAGIAWWGNAQPESLAKKWQIIRTADGQHLIGDKVYFYQNEEMVQNGLPAFKQNLLNGTKRSQIESAKSFVEIAGVRPVSEEVQVNHILQSYYSSSDYSAEKRKKLSWAIHREHIVRFIRCWREKKDPNLFRSYKLFYDQKASGWYSSRVMFIDEPIKETGLAHLYEDRAILAGKKFALNRDYREIESFVDFAVGVGVTDRIEIRKTNASQNPNQSKLMEGFLGASRSSTYEINEDYVIDGLDKLLSLGNAEVSRLIWKTLCESDPKVLSAKYRPNSKYNCNEVDSQLVFLLRNHSWIPSKDGSFKRPNEMRREMLASGFDYDDRNSWLTAIGFGESRQKLEVEAKSRENAAQVLGIPTGVVEELADCTPQEQEKLFQFLMKEKRRLRASRITGSGSTALSGDNLSGTGQKSQNGSANTAEDIERSLTEAFAKEGQTRLNVAGNDPSPIRDSARYRQNVSGKYQKRLHNEPAPQERVRTSTIDIWEPKNKSVRDFFIEEYGGCCQVCQQTFPRRDGKPYFEAVYLYSHSMASWTDEPGCALCLCALCSAKFQHGSVECPDVMIKLLGLKIEAESGTPARLQIQLVGESRSIQFSDRHLIEIQELLRLAMTTEKMGAV